MEQLSLTYLKEDEFKRLREPSLDFRDIQASSGIYSIHPYPAVFHFMLVRHLLLKFSEEESLVFDPFCGSGVCAGECLKLNRNFVGYDVNPLAILISKVRTTPLDTKKLRTTLNELLNSEVKFEVVNFPNIHYWFDEEIIVELSDLRARVFSIEDQDMQDFFKVVFSQTVREVSLAESKEFKLVRSKRGEKKDVKRTFEKIALKNIESLREIEKLKRKDITLEVRNILDGIPLEDESVDLVITSPPYGDSRTTVAYEQFSRLSLRWLGLDNGFEKHSLGWAKREITYDLPSRILYRCLETIGQIDEKRAKEVFSFYKDLFSAIENISKKVKTNGYVIFVVGNRRVRGVLLPTDKICADFFEHLGFSHIRTLVRQIHNKRMPLLNSPTNVKGQKSQTMGFEYVVVLRKNPMVK
ncbi:DNA methyltransferase [Thermocrinis sp.]